MFNDVTQRGDSPVSIENNFHITVIIRASDCRSMRNGVSFLGIYRITLRTVGRQADLSDPGETVFQRI